MKGSTEKQLPATQEPVVVPEPVTPAAPAKPVTSAAATPRAACEGRVLFGFQNCMSEQCAKPVFFQHPTCVERRAMDEQRRETERNR
jgi:serine/threonine-protein kinase